MPFARFEFFVQDARGNILPGAEVTVREEATGAPLATLYSDRDGAVPLANPFTVGSDGLAAFHVVGGVYRITATSGSFTADFRYKGIGGGDTLPDQVSGAEITAGTETALRSFSPKDVADMAAEHGGGGGGGGGRELLTANRTYYVRTDGNDSNDGLANTSGGAFLTIQKAIDVVSAIDLSAYSVTIQLGAGTYSEHLTLKSYAGAGPAWIKGDETTPANVVLAATAAANVSGSSAIGKWHISGVKFTQSSSFQHIVCEGPTHITFEKVTFNGTSGGHQILARNGGLVQALGNYTVAGGGASHIFGVQGGIFVYQNSGTTVTVSGTPAFSAAFAVAQRGGLISCAAVPTFSGSATGARYTVEHNSVIFTSGSGASFFPGNSAGSAATGGQYI